MAAFSEGASIIIPYTDKAGSWRQLMAQCIGNSRATYMVGYVQDLSATKQFSHTSTSLTTTIASQSGASPHTGGGTPSPQLSGPSPLRELAKEPPESSSAGSLPPATATQPKPPLRPGSIQPPPTPYHASKKLKKTHASGSPGRSARAEYESSAGGSRGGYKFVIQPPGTLQYGGEPPPPPPPHPTQHTSQHHRKRGREISHHHTGAPPPYYTRLPRPPQERSFFLPSRLGGGRGERIPVGHPLETKNVPISPVSGVGGMSGSTYMGRMIRPRGYTNPPTQRWSRLPPSTKTATQTQQESSYVPSSSSAPPQPPGWERDQMP